MSETGLDEAAAHRRLDDLAQRIHQMRDGVAVRGGYEPDIERDAKEMLDRNDRLRATLGGNESPQREVIEAEIEALRESFESWVTRIDRHFAHPQPSTDRTTDG